MERSRLVPTATFRRTVSLADAFHLERDGVHRLLEVLDALIGQLRARWILAQSRRHQQPPQVPHGEQHGMGGGMHRLAHRDGEGRA